MTLVEATNLSLAGRLAETPLRLEAGQLACLIGPNGSGKTSLLHALAGIGAPAGEVRIGGVDPWRRAPAERMRLLSFLPAAREAHWPMKARDIVALGCARSDDEEHIAGLLEELHLSEFENRRIDRMSTGERSRVLIARALVSRPRLLLLDEPAANLDPLWQLRLMAFLRQRARKGAALLVAVHDLELAREFADRLIVMDGGSIVADGVPADILAGPVMSRVFGIERRCGRWEAVG